MIKCACCGILFKSKTRKKDAKFCSCECSNLGRQKNKRECPVCFGHFFASTQRQKTCSIKCKTVLRKSLSEKKCKSCGEIFLPKRRGKEFCCLECRKSFFVKKHEKKCPICGEVFSSRKNVFCSKICATDAFKRVASGKEKRCAHCGKHFSSLKSNAVFCSDFCRVSANKRMRSYKARGAKGKNKISIEAIADRDGWGCKICGKKINKNLSSNDGAAPTIDHIIALSRGGDHIWSNVQLAHRSCNSKKGNSSRSFQMSLNINLSFNG